MNSLVKRGFAVLKMIAVTALWQSYRRFPGPSINFPYPDMELREFRSMSEFQSTKNSIINQDFEIVVAKMNRHNKRWNLGGFCQACGKPTRFLGDWRPTLESVPAYREKLCCEHCGLSSRQRFIIHYLKELLGTNQISDIYLYEQTTRFYQYVKKHFEHINVVGSEFLGYGAKPGKAAFGIRHEDALNLSFESESFDVILSLEVNEHVPDVGRALSEACRVLRANGRLVISIPFNWDEAETRKRAELSKGKVDYLLPAKYHGVVHRNPVNWQGYLVFYDFGWDFLKMCENAGFRDAHAIGYHSARNGYLGNGLQMMFVAEK